MSRVNAFNPAAFAQQPKEQSDGAGQAAAGRKAKKDLPYQVTDNSSRDQVRKMLWDAFGGNASGQAQSGQDEQGAKYEAHELVAMLEEEVFKMSKEDAKTKEYRDRCNKLQMKLKGPRYAQTRQDLKMATVTVEHVCSDEYLNSKAQASAGPPGMGRGGPPGMARGRGMAGPSPRGRGGPPGLMGRGRGAPPMGRPPNMPAFRPPVASEPEKAESSEQPAPEPKNEVKQEEEKLPEKEEEKPPSEKSEEPIKEKEEPPKQQEEPAAEQQKPPAEEQQQQQAKPPAAQFMPPKPMGRGGPRPPMRGMPPNRGRGAGPPGMGRGGPFPGQRPGAIPQTKSSPPVPDKQESEQSIQQKPEEKVPEIQVQPETPPPSAPETKLVPPLNLNETSKLEESVENSRIELEFPNTSNLIGEDAADPQSKNEKSSVKSGSDKQEGTSGPESSNKEKSNANSNSQNNEDSTSQVASQSDNKIPNFDASLDDSQIIDPNNTSISLPKKVKKIKKVKKKVKKKLMKADQSLEMSMRQEDELNGQLNLSQHVKPEERPPKIEDERQINLPLQPKAAAAQKSHKPMELTSDQVQNLIKEKQDNKAQVALLTKEKLEQFDNQFPNKFNRGGDLDDTDLESVYLDQSAISPRMPIQPAQEIVQQVANQLEMKPVEFDKPAQNQQSQKQTGAGENAANKEGNTIKSKSLSHSQAGVHDSDAVRRLQETLQSKKELVTELNQKYQSSQSDYQILQKKFKLVQDENQKLKDELSQQKANFRQNEERVFNLNQQLVLKEQANQRIQKEKDDLVSQLMAEVNTLKQERDLYMDRYQKTLKESIAERQKVERKMHMNSFNNSNDIVNVLKQVQMFASSAEYSPHQIDTASSGGQQQILRSSSRNRDDHGKGDEHGTEILSHVFGGGSSPNGGVGHHHERQTHLNSASNYQEINLQNQLNVIKEQYEQKLKDQQKQLDGVTLDLHKVQKLNDSYRENNRKLTDAVQQNIERGNISVMAGSGAPNTTTDMLYQQMMDNISQEDIDDDDSLPPSSQQPQVSPAPENNRQGTVNEAMVVPQSDQSTSKHLFGGGKQPAASQASASTSLYQGSQQQQQQQPDHGAEHGSQRQGGAGGNGGNRSSNNQRQQNYRNIQPSYFENQQDEATGGESHHGFQNSSQNIFEDNMQQNIADQQSALAQDNNTINDQSVLDHFQNNHQSSALQTSSHIPSQDPVQTSQNNNLSLGIPNIEGGTQPTASNATASNVHILDTSHHSGSVAAHHHISAPQQQQQQQQQNSAAAAAAMKGHHGKYSNIMMDSDQHQQQQQRSVAGGSAQQMQQDHSGDRDDRAIMDEGVVVDSNRRLRDKVNKTNRMGDDGSPDPDDDDANKSESEITEEDDMDDESRDESRDDDFRDSQAYSGMDEDELDDDDSEDSQGSNDDPQNDLGQIGLDNQNEMSSNALQGTLGGASGSQNDRRSADVGGLNSQNQHIGPGAIPSQNFPQGANNQNRNLRQTGSGVRYGAHGNMPHQFQQNAQQQYGSSGASGHSRQMQLQHTQNQQNDESKNASGYPMQSHQTASASGATGSGVSNTNQRRNRRGNRQQNQQPSSGANGGENVAVRRSNRQNNNRQGRQTLENVASGGGGSSQMTISNREPNDVGAAHGHRHSGGNQNQRMNERSAATANSQDQQHYQTNNQQDQRGRSQRTYNRGRQQRNNQQQQQIGQNAAAPTQQSNSSGGQQMQSSLQQQPAPVSLSQEREQKAQNQGYNRFMSAGLGSGSGSAQEMQMSSQSAAQAHLRRMNMGSGSGQATNENQAVQQVIQMNAPASTQSHYSRGNHQQQNYQQRQQLLVQSSAIQGAASQTHMNSQSSQMIPASTASHSGDTQSLGFPRGYEGQNNQQTTGAPHGGGGSQRQVSGSRMQDSSSNQAASMGQQEGRNSQNTHHNGVVHTVSFESGSTSFMDRQANSGLAAGEQSQPSYGGSHTVNRQNQYNQRPKNTFTQISQVSSPPSNNMNIMGGQMMPQVRNQSNQQNDILAHQFTQNTPNSDMSGPGAVGAPPSSSQQLGAINPAAQSSQLGRPPSQQQYQSTNMPSSSGINESTANPMMMAAHQPHQQQQQNVSPVSSQTASGGQGTNPLQNSGPGQGGGGAHHQGQHINPRMQQNQSRGVPLPSVPENTMMHHHGAGRDMPPQQHLEEEKQSSHQLGSGSHHQQQSIMTIPSSLFGGGGNQSNNASMSMSGIQEHQTPAALQMVGIGNDGLDSSAGTGTIHFNNNTSNLFGSGFDDGQQNSLMNYLNSGEQRATPPRRNNDSRKTSGANTPSRDGANTPTTHQSQSQQMTMGMWLTNQN